MEQHKGLILLVEDSKRINSANAKALRMKGHEVVVAERLSEAREHLAGSDFDVILLDVMLPDGDGFGFGAEIRAKVEAHLIYVTAKNTLEDKICGLKSGGDAYLTKPYHIEEMLAMVEAGIRRMKMGKAPVGQTTKKGSLRLDAASLRAYMNEVDIMLTAREFSMLQMFFGRENEVIPAKELYEKVWGQKMAGDKTAVQVTVARLRKKIGNSEYTISTSYNKGYVFERA